MMETSKGATITIVVDNKADGGLVTEHGFSAWVELGERRLLFDTGQGLAISTNVDELGLDLQTADWLLLSHGHYDHTGGLPFVLERAPGVEVYAHPAAIGPHFAVRGGLARSIDMPAAARSALEAHRGEVHWITTSERLGEGIGVTGPIPRLTDYEDRGGPFFLDAAGAKEDLLEDDLALWLRTAEGLVVIVGCSHSGIVNTLRYALESSGEARLRAVIGGFHLLAASDHRLARTVAALEELEPEVIVPCHCTGEGAVARLEEAFGERVEPGFAGARYTFVV